MRFPALATAITVVFFVALFSGCGSLEEAIRVTPKPDAKVLGASVRNLKLRSVDVVFDIEVSNPYTVSLPLIDLSYTIGSSGQQLLSGSIKPSGSIPAGGSSVIQLPARVDLESVLQILPAVKPGAVVPYSAQIQVIVNAPLLGEIDLPVRRNGEIPVPAIPEVTLVSLDVLNFGLDEVKAEARLRVKNTNRFHMQFSGLRFDLALGDRTVARARLRNSSKLAPGQIAVLKIPVTFFTNALGAGALDLLSGSDAAYAITGKIDVMTRFGEMVLPFSERGETIMRRQ
ncbi:MAG: hypothetical protein GTO41_05430 [Burkholderiales bacterium]|nr:hypothetical protein [Burkholderiales bacterium]